MRSEKQTAKRTCWDRLRFRNIQRRRGWADPAMSVSMQLLTIVLLVIGRAPRLPAWPARGGEPEPRPARREDWSREQQEREEGEGGQEIILPRPSHRAYGRYVLKPPFRRLVRDLRRPHLATSAEAADMLRRRVPPEALPWLDDVLETKDWPALAWCARPGMSEKETEEAMLRSALAWTEGRSGLGTPGPDGTTLGRIGP